MSDYDASTEDFQSLVDELSECDDLERYLPPRQHEAIRIFGRSVGEDGIRIHLEIQSPRGVPSIIYPLSGYEMVTEFRRMLACPLEAASGDDWNGSYFHAFHSHYADRVYLRGKAHGVTIYVKSDQWQHIQAAFDEAFASPEYARVWIDRTIVVHTRHTLQGIRRARPISFSWTAAAPVFRSPLADKKQKLSQTGGPPEACSQQRRA